MNNPIDTYKSVKTNQDVTPYQAVQLLMARWIVFLSLYMRSEKTIQMYVVRP
jgi:flagellar protein FliS